MVSSSRARAFHEDRDEHGQTLSAAQREKLLKPYLPAPQERASYSSPDRFQRRARVRPAVQHIIHSLIFSIVHTFFSAYIRVRQAYHSVVNQVLSMLYYHHRTPELIQRDMKGLKKVPKHLSVILQLPPEGGKKDSAETWLNDACEVVAWAAGAGVPLLSIYERTGVLKHSLPHLHRRISQTLAAYYGESSPTKPTISIRAPNQPSYSPPSSPSLTTTSTPSGPPQPHLTIILISALDGRRTLVDLTKTLAEMSQRGKLSPLDISSELVDAEISESVMTEPDLIISFGDRIVLDGYPPWQARLSEMFCVQDNAGGVGYHVFLRALHKYGQAQFRLGS